MEKKWYFQVMGWWSMISSALRNVPYLPASPFPKANILQLWEKVHDHSPHLFTEIAGICLITLRPPSYRQSSRRKEQVNMMAVFEIVTKGWKGNKRNNSTFHLTIRFPQSLHCHIQFVKMANLSQPLLCNWAVLKLVQTIKHQLHPVRKLWPA